MSELKFTRKQYMAGEVSHNDYYAQFLTANTIADVVRLIGSEDILASTDKHLNDIALHRWDLITGFAPARAGGPYYGRGGLGSPAFRLDKHLLAQAEGAVYYCSLLCVAKEAARQYKEESQCTTI